MLPYPYPDLAAARHRDYRRRAEARRLVAFFKRNARSGA